MTAPALLDVGLHYGISESRYHADPCVEPSLSSSLVRTILNRSVGHAKLEHPRLSKVTPREQTDAMVLGSTVHALMAGDVSNLATDGEFDNYKTKLAQEWRDSAKAAGKTPVLARTFQRAEMIAAALRAGVFPDGMPKGDHEVTAIWKEHPWGEDGPAIYCRARYDLLLFDAPHYGDIYDWKTRSGSLTRDELARTIAGMGYDLQIAHYLRGLEVLRPDIAQQSMTLTFVEVEEPYAVQSVCLSGESLARAKSQWRRLMHEWAVAYRNEAWPTAEPGTVMLDLPAWRFGQSDEIQID
jgi:hypothetical protein